MSAPTRPVPPEQQRRFGLAVCARLGLDPELVLDGFHWKVTDERLGTVTFTVALPADEIIAMFNGAADIVPAPTETHHCHADGQGPCVAGCCPIAGRPAPAWCRPDPHGAPS